MGVRRHAVRIRLRGHSHRSNKTGSGFHGTMRQRGRKWPEKLRLFLRAFTRLLALAFSLSPDRLETGPRPSLVEAVGKSAFLASASTDYGVQVSISTFEAFSMVVLDERPVAALAADFDADGVIDARDNCPDVSNPGQVPGLLDEQSAAGLGEHGGFGGGPSARGAGLMPQFRGRTAR